MFIDSHCHLQHCFNNKELFSLEVPKIASILTYFVDISTNANEFLNLIKMDLPACLLYSFGLNPEEAPSYCPESRRDFDKIISLHRPHAVGESGLDYHWNFATPGQQEILFRDQIESSIKNDLPLIVHSRDSFFDTYRILSGYSFKKDVIIHCFGYGRKEAEKFLAGGFFISFAGNLTYPGAINLKEAASIVPLDRILLETDSPYLTPLPLRGTLNNPVNVIHTYRYLAELLKIEEAELEKAILKNFNKIYGLS